MSAVTAESSRSAGQVGNRLAAVCRSRTACRSEQDLEDKIAKHRCARQIRSQTFVCEMLIERRIWPNV